MIATLTLSADRAAAFPIDWGTEELEAARSFGVDLEQPPTDLMSAGFAFHLAWLADIVMYAEVVSIRYPMVGPYLTIVELQVGSVLKGSSNSERVFVDLISGPYYVGESARFGNSWASDESSFEIGEKVLVFLTRERLHDPREPDAYAHEPGHYSLVNGVKWTVHGDCVDYGYAGSSTQSLPVEALTDDIEKMAAVQEDLPNLP